MIQTKIYEEPIHEVGINNDPNWQPKGVILDRVITDEGYRYDFFNKSHKIIDSGGSWIYDLPSRDAFISDPPMTSSDLVSDPDSDPTLQSYWLNSNMILDLDTEDPFSDTSAAMDLGNHIDKLGTPQFYGKSVSEVIQGINSGDRIMFAVLYNMYYYAMIDNKQWPYVDRVTEDVRLWYQSILDSVINGSRQWANDSYEYITDWPDYPQGYTIYHPYYFMSHPGLVFECFKECRGSDEYVIRSCNGFDNHAEYRVSQDVLECILRGNHWGLQIFADSVNLNHISDVMMVDGLLSKFEFNTALNYRYQWPLVDSTHGDVASDKEMIIHEVTNNRTWTDPESGIIYNTNELLDSEPIDTPYNYPVFMTVTGHIERPQETHNGHPIFTEIIDGEDVEFLNHTDMEIRKVWDDDACRAFRPETISFDLYIYKNNTPYYYRTIDMSSEDHRMNENTWSSHINVPMYTSDDQNTPIDYLLVENTVPVPPDLINNVIGDTVYSASYNISINIGSEVWGHPGLSEESYSMIVTNTMDSSGKVTSGDIPVTINKLWYDADCEYLQMAITGYIKYGTSIEWNLPDSHHNTTINIPWEEVNPSIFITENLSIPNFHYIVSHSDNCREWTVNNIPDSDPLEPGRHPEDPSGHGDLFYFEMDPECYDWCNNRDVVGFLVTNGWGKFGNGMDVPLYYKIVYLDDDEYPENTMDPGSQEYYDFLLTGWKKYWIDAVDEQVEAGSLKYTLSYEPSFTFEGVIVDYDSEIRNKNQKVRIYIGAESTPKTHLYGFSILTLTKDKSDSYYASCYFNAAPKKDSGITSAPIRCGGWLGALYNIDSKTIESVSNYEILGSRWEIRNIILNSTNSYFNDSWAIHSWYYDPFHKKIKSKIHTDRIFDIAVDVWDPQFNMPERFALSDLEDDVYNPHDTTGYDYLMGDLFDGIFLNMKNLVDASQLFIFKPYLDLQYFRTFKGSGLGFSQINPKVSHHTTPYLPYYDENSPDPDSTFAPFKDMYRECKNIQYIDNYAIMCPEEPDEYTGRLGMHYYDGMFRNSGVKDLNIHMPFVKGDGAPWGVCKGMFAGCRFDWVGTDLISGAVNIGGHAFRDMFRHSVVKFQTMPKYDQALNSFTFANTYFNAAPWADQQIECQLPREQVYYGVYWGMFAYSHYNSVNLGATSFNRWSFGYMFKNSFVEVIKTHHNQWYYMGDYKAHLNWVKGIYCGNAQSANQYCFYKPQRLAKYFGPNRIPKTPKWLVMNL